MSDISRQDLGIAAMKSSYKKEEEKIPRDFTKIKAWQLAEDLAVDVYRETKHFPREEMYGLTSQLRRAASSVPANIAEGSNRTSKAEYLQFLSVACGSLAEVRYSLHLARRLGYIDDVDYTKSSKLAEETIRTIAGLVSFMRAEQKHVPPARSSLKSEV